MFATFAIAVILSAPPATTYADVRTFVENGMPLVVYAGVPLPTKAEPNAVRVDAIPGEPAGVYDCRRVDGRPTMAQRIPTGRPKRVVIGGKYYDQYADGSCVECVECNRGR